MREAEFRAWLEARRWNGKPLSETAIYGRIRRLHRVERSLANLGFDQTDLDTLSEAGDFASLREKLRVLIDSAPSGERPPSSLVPQAADPSGQLRNLLAVVRQYQQFANGVDPNAHDVEPTGGANREPADWIVTARFGEEDGFEQFLETGSWSLPSLGRYSDKLRTVQLGDRIAVRDYFHQKHDLPFATNGARVSVMRFRAVGVVTANAGDGLSISVDWSPTEPPRIWFFYTNQEALWRLPDAETAARLAAFVFDGEEQDYDWWLARPYWRDRLVGDKTDADRIRRHVVDEYIEPARAAGADTVEVHVLTINNEIGLDKAWPNICQALEGPKMQQLSGLSSPVRIGAPMSTATRFIFSLKQGRAAAPMSEPTNLILYGPPGTGKTYATAEHAVRLCDGLAAGDPLLGPGQRPALMARYKELAKDERIEFVTFHQSMAYEEFAEGLRPSSVDKDGQPLAAGFQLLPTPGIFRKIAERAETLRARAADDGFELGTRQVFKMSLGEAANPDDDYLYDEAMAGGYVLLGDDSGVDWTAPGLDTKAAMIDAFAADHPERPRLSPLSGYIEFAHTLRSRVQVGDLVIVSKGNLLFRAIGEVTGAFEPTVRENGDDYRWRRCVRWLWRDDNGKPYDLINAKRFSQRTIYELSRRELKADAIESLLATGAGGDAGPPQPFVLVIDEINRANISKVFGELITLLEADKRIDAPNELRVRLPYSGDSFGVPANLHIVGTMNTADRSIALIDKALRRRFTFTEMMPDYDVEGMDAEVAGAGVTLAQVLRAINNRIEYLLDREHQIGHGWLLGRTTKAALDAAMRDKIIPLIAEYFFEDWGRTADVLGGRDDNPFLQATTLKPPPGMKDEEPRMRWSVRDTFAPDAYTRLIAG